MYFSILCISPFYVHICSHPVSRPPPTPSTLSCTSPNLSSSCLITEAATDKEATCTDPETTAIPITTRTATAWDTELRGITEMIHRRTDQLLTSTTNTMTTTAPRTGISRNLSTMHIIKFTRSLNLSISSGRAI